jgi:hypothetical protein
MARYLRAGDLVVAGLLLVVAATSAVLIPAVLAGGRGLPSRVEVRVLEPGGGGEVIARIDLPDQATVELGRGGMVLQVSGHTARVIESDCPQKICTRTVLTRVGDRTVCVPNGVVVEMTGDSADRPYDMIVR